MIHRKLSISKDEILGALKRLGALAQAHGLELTLCLLGDAVMIIEHDARKTTDRVDTIILAPSKRNRPNRDSDILELSALIAKEKGWAGQLAQLSGRAKHRQDQNQLLVIVSGNRSSCSHNSTNVSVEVIELEQRR